MPPDFVFIVTYQCPRCHAALEDRAGGAPAWVRCPNCGRAGLTPEPQQGAYGDRFEPADVFATSGPDPIAAALPFRPRPMAPRPEPSHSRALTTRKMLGSGFFLTSVLFLIMLLDGNGVGASIFGVAALLLLFLLSRPIAPNIRG